MTVLREHSRIEHPRCRVCGDGIGRWSHVYQQDYHELICEARGTARLVITDAAVTCSIECLVKYLSEWLEAPGSPGFRKGER